MIKKYNDFVNEKFINWFVQREESKKYEKYKDDIQRMLDISYKDIGGYKNGDYNIDEFIEECSLIKISMKNSIPIAFKAYKDSYGRKGIAVATDGTPEGKAALYKIFEEDMKFMRAWVEVDSKLEHILVDKFSGQRIPNTLVQKIIKKDIELDKDDYHYFREIGGMKKRKCLVTSSSEEFIKKYGLDNE